MLSRIIQFSVENKLIIAILTLALIGWGVFEVTQLPIDAVPDITDNQVQIITVSPALGATDIERLITVPIEQSISNIPGRKELRSFSRFGLSLITIVFDDETDVYWARQQISERLQQVQSSIPEGVGKPEMAPVTTGLGEIYQYTVRAAPGFESRYSLSELRTIQDWYIRRQLLGTPGVADVSSFGGNLKQYEIAVQPQWLASREITLDEIVKAVEQNNSNTGGSYIEKGPQALFIRTEGLTQSIQDLESIVVGYKNESPVLLRDVAAIKEGKANRFGAVCYNDQGETVGAIVMMLKGANSSEVINDVKVRIEEIKKTLPEGVIIEPFLDRTKMVNNAIHTVETNLIEGALIVIFVLVLFLGQLRAGLLVASVIPLAMLFAVGMMNIFGVSGNLMSLGAIDFGMIVDGTVIIIEAIMHQITHHKKWKEMQGYSQIEMNSEVKSASSRILNSAVFGQLIILIVYLPLLTLSGIEGKMFKPMAQTLIFAIIGAFILSLTYVPMMATLFLPRKLKSNKISISDRMMIFIERNYQRSLERIFKRSKIIMLFTIFIFACAVFTSTFLGGEFIPKLEEGDFAVETRVLTGSNLNTTIESSQKASHLLLQKFPEIEKIVTKIGSGEIPTDPMPMEAADMMIILKPKSEWTSAESFDELAEKMGEEGKKIPGLSLGFQYPVQMRFNELMTGARQDVVCKIYGEDLDSLSRYASKLSTIAESIEGVKDIYVESVTGMPQIIIKLKREQLAKYGITVEEANAWIETAFAGKTAGSLYEGEKKFDIVIRSDENFRNKTQDVLQMIVTNRNNVPIPLSAIAAIEETDGVNQVQRENTRRRIIIGFNVRGRDVQSVVQDIKNKEEKEIKFPDGYSINYGGTFENLTAAKDRLSIVVPIALSMIFLLLYFALGSIKDSLLVYTAIPLSAIGGIFTLFITGTNFSISAGVGFIALFGVAVLEGILMIAEFKRLESEGWNDYKRIAAQGTKIRLRSVLMTALAPSLGFIPMAISQGAGAEVQRPLALVVIGGLVSATILTLYVLPILYVWQRNLSLKKKIVLPVTVLLALLSFTNIHAQQETSLEELILSAEKNNLSIQAAKLSFESECKKGSVYRNWGPISISNEYGNVNSAALDHRISISESFHLPGYSESLNNQQQKKIAIAEQQISIARKEVFRLIKQGFFNCAVLSKKIALLQENISRIDEVEKLTKKRIELGDETAYANLLVEQQKLQFTQQLMQLTLERNQELYSLQHLVGWSEKLILSENDIEFQYSSAANEDFINSEIRIAQLEQDLSITETEILKQLKKPTLELALNNMSIVGYQNITGADQYYGPTSRFTSFSAAIVLPGNRKKQNATLAVSMVNTDIQKLKTNLLIREFDLKLNSLFEQLNQVNNQLASLAKWVNDSEQVKQVSNQINKQLETGDISYIEWSYNNQNLMQMQLNFWSTLQLKNNTLIEIEFIKEK
jgi:cobalt-zinc-cadmium resistance protein CzcA